MTKLTIKTLNELLTTNYDPPKWIVDKIVPEESIVLLSAAPASFKTWLALEISIKVASGETLLGRFSTDKTGVLLIDEEGGDRQLNWRLNALGATKDLPIFYSSYAGRKLDDEYTTQLIKFCEENGVKLVIWDSFTRFLNGLDENKSDDMSQIFERFSQFKKAGITCLILHHNRKSNGYGSTAEASRGSSNILASCDLHIALSRRGDNISVIQTKNRLDVELSPFTARCVKLGNRSEWQFVEYETTSEEKRDILKNTIVQFVADNPGKNQKQILEGLNVDDSGFIKEKKLRELLNELVADKVVYFERGDRTEKWYFVCDDSDDEGERQNG